MYSYCLIIRAIIGHVGKLDTLYPIKTKKKFIKKHRSSSILKRLILLIRQIQPVLIGSCHHIILNIGRSLHIVTVTQRAIREDRDNRDNIADNHGDGTARVCWGLVRTERLRPDNVSCGPRNVEPCVKGDSNEFQRQLEIEFTGRMGFGILLSVTGDVGLIDGYKRDVRSPVRAAGLVRMFQREDNNADRYTYTY